jgi:hypothetical protein
MFYEVESMLSNKRGPIFRNLEFQVFEFHFETRSHFDWEPNKKISKNCLVAKSL